MSTNFVCHKCLLHIKSNDIYKKSEFEYFHIVCINNEDLVDVTDKFTYNDIATDKNLKLKTEINKLVTKFIDLSSKEKIYKQDKFKNELNKDLNKDLNKELNKDLNKDFNKKLTELEEININKFNDFDLDNFINEFNKYSVNCLITNKSIKIH